LSSFFILLTLVIICISTIVMRYTKPELNRGFYCPLMPATPIIAILLATYIMSSYPIQIYINACMVLIILTFLYFIQRKLNTRK
jgi:APA family basic amino acid/polyamine antiporter